MFNKIDVWFNKYSTGCIGVLEKNGDRILIKDEQTIAEIEANVKKFIAGPFKGERGQDAVTVFRLFKNGR